MSLIAELNRLQEARGYLPDGDLQEFSARTGVPLYRIEEVASFYPHFRRTPPPRVEVAVCRDVACFLADGDRFAARVKERLAGDEGIEVHEVSCLGRCDSAPAALVGGVPVGGATPEEAARCARDPAALRARAPRRSRRAWRTDPYADPADAYSIYREWTKRPAEKAAAEVIAALKAADLRGMGGAGFPTGKKWEIVRGEPGTPKYVVCNADESEPGTFKDRVILEQLPHLVIEGMCFAARVVGAERGWIYLRHEYGPEAETTRRAIEDARERGVLGDGFDVELFISPGGYILGEETALLEALEDRRGEPRNKPPYPGQKGLWGKPTVVNNVETLAFVPAIARGGAEWWAAQGTRGHAGLKFMAVCGHVERPGVYEIPMGTTVAELIERAGGVKGGKRLKGFSPGGASSNFLPAEKADVEIDFDSIRDAGSMLGSGALLVVAEGTDMIEVAANVVRFFRNESCGKCVPCRVGTQKVVRMLEEILAGKGDGTLLEVLPGLEETLVQTSICGLGQVAVNPLTSSLRYWKDEMLAHLARAGAR